MPSFHWQEFCFWPYLNAKETEFEKCSLPVGPGRKTNGLVNS